MFENDEAGALRACEVGQTNETNRGVNQSLALTSEPLGHASVDLG
jgi:hypothetical protein